MEAGEATLVWQGHELTLKQQETCFLPAGNRDAALQIDESVRCVWIALEGPLAPMVVRKMGALLHMPLKQGRCRARCTWRSRLCRSSSATRTPATRHISCST